VVEPAGNGNEDLDRNLEALNAWRSWGDSGAIIVGAGKPSAGTPPGDPVTRHNRCAPCTATQPPGAQFSSSYGSRVNVQGWGEFVFTLGFGTYANLPTGRGSYTEKFSGTSSASPMVAGEAASLQSIRVNKGLSRLTPATMRQLLIDTGIPQGSATANTPIGPFPNLAKAILQLGIGPVDCEPNGVPDQCDAAARACCRPDPYNDCIVTTQQCCADVGGGFRPSLLTCTALCPM
jgi:hypothetical protein